MIRKFIDKYRNLSENNKNIAANVLGAFAIKGLSLVVTLFAMPSYLRFFNNETVLGLWFTLYSVINWMLNFDLGIGNGLRNKLTEAIAEHNGSEAKKLISSAYISVGMMGLGIGLLFFFISSFIDWNSIFNIQTDIISSKALLLAIRIMFIGIVLKLFFKLITSILYAIQKSAVNNFVALCSSILTIVCVNIMPSMDNDSNIINMAIVHIVAGLLPLLLVTILTFQKNEILRSNIPSLRDFSKKHAKSVLTLGGIFLLVQVEYMLIMNSNEYLITIFYNGAAVVDYQIYHKWYMLGSTIVSMAMTPIWSAVTKAASEHNFSWIHSLYTKLLHIALIGIAGQFLIIPIMPLIIKIWVPEREMLVRADYSLAFAVLAGCMILNSVFTSIANGVGELRTQAIFFGIGTVLKVPLSYCFINLFHSWVGVVWANVICMGIHLIIQPCTLKRHLQYMKRQL